jgi:hypothetical protein
MDTMLANSGWGGASGAGRFMGGDIYTAAEIEEMNKKPPKEKDKWQLDEAFGQLANSALSGAQSLDDLAAASVDMIGQLGNQFLQNSVGGLGGMLLGGGFQFLTNLLSFNEQELPVRDGALDVRLVEIVDSARDFTARRDATQLSFQAERRRSFDSLRRGA